MKLSDKNGDLVEAELDGALRALDMWFKSQGFDQKEVLFLGATYLGLFLFSTIEAANIPEEKRTPYLIEGATHLIQTMCDNALVPLTVAPCDDCKPRRPRNAFRN